MYFMCLELNIEVLEDLYTNGHLGGGSSFIYVDVNRSSENAGGNFNW